MSASVNRSGSGSASANRSGSGSASANRSGSGSASVNRSGSSSASVNRSGSDSASVNRSGSGSASANRSGSGSASANRSGSSSASANRSGSSSASANRSGSGSGSGSAAARLRYAYNTNGAANHRLDDALTLIADSGYDGVALTLDIHHLDPYGPDFRAETRRVAARLASLGLGAVVETGARFLLDPRAKHEPTLVTRDPAGRARRIDFLTRALEVAAETGAEAMSFWAGVPKPGVTAGEAQAWLLEGVAEVARRAERLGTVAALEPEPGMAIETVADWRRLGVPGLRLALDVGHCIVTGDIDPAEAVREYAAHLGTVSIEDMKRGVHLHLPFGEGDMDVPGVLAALRAIGYRRLVCVELSRESPRADQAVPHSLAWLRRHEGGRAAA